MASEPSPEFELNPRIEMRLEQFPDGFVVAASALNQFEAQCRSSQTAGDEYQIARSSSRTCDSPPYADLTHDRDGDEDFGIPSSVAAGDLNSHLAGRAAHPFKKPIEPFPGAAIRQSERKKIESRESSHRRQVAGSANQGFVAYRIRWIGRG